MSDKESTGASSGERGAGGAARCVETAALIELVRARPCLWDRSSAQYRARADKERAWRDVYRALDPHYDHMSRAQRKDFGVLVSRKWANIRDSYKKYLNGSHRVVNSRPYLYAGLLTFLDAVYQADSKGKLYFEHKEEHDPPAPPAGDHEWLNEVFVDMETRGGDSPDHKKMRTDYPRLKDAPDGDESIVSVLVGLIEKEEDEDRAFFKSITPTVKSLSESDKFLFRIRVMKLLDSLKKKESLPSTKRETACQESESE